MSDDLPTRVLAWCKRNDGGRLGVWWPAGSQPGSGSRPILAIMWDHGGTGELGTFYNEKDADKMDLICDVFNWAIEQLAPSEQSFYGERTYGREREQIAFMIRNHWYDSEDETCSCISSSAASKSEIVHMSIVEHSEHVADVILGRKKIEL
jgi:hypothetical protein